VYFLRVSELQWDVSMRASRFVSRSIAPFAICALLIVWTLVLAASQAKAECLPSDQNPAPGAPGICICRIGPVSFPAPACDIQTLNLEGERDEYVEWQNGASYQVLLITPKRPQRFKGYLARWHHKCTKEERQIGEPTRLQPRPGSDPKYIPPQVTWSGICAAPDDYIIRAIAVGQQVVEFHIWNGPGGAAREQAFTTLLDQVRIAPALSVRH
jgi:hypothetical protein